jgi:uncharacterized membrane protein
MKTELVFFDSLHQSKNGTFRGLVAFVLLLSISALWFYITYNAIYKSSMQSLNPNFRSIRSWISYIIIYVLLCSALAVQLPSSCNNALVYGLLVGLVVFGITNFVFVSLMKDYSITTAIIDTLFGIVMCGIVSLCVYYISKKVGWYSNSF